MGSGAAALFSTDGGSTWSVGTLPSGVGDWSLSSVSCASTGVCVAASDAAQVLYSTDGGSTWSVGTLPSGVGDWSLSSVSCASTGVCVTVGLTGSGVAALYSTDGGSTWSVGTLPSGVSDLSSVSCASTSDCVAVGDDLSGDGGVGVVLVSTDGGSTWSAGTLPSGASYWPLLSVSCASMTDCVAVGYYFNGSSEVGAALFSTDGGSTWSAGTLPSEVNLVYSVSCTPGGCFATGEGDTTTIGAVVLSSVLVPTVTSVSPVFGPTTGGTSVTINGTNLSGATAVDFGGTPAASFSSVSDSQVTAVSPPGSDTVDVTVSTPAGTSSTNSVDQFTFVKASQTMTFTSTAPTDATVGGATYTPTSAASSGLPVTLTIDPTTSANCTISGGVVGFTATGTCTIDANQAGDANYNPAPQVQETFVVSPAGPVAVADHYYTPVNTKLAVNAPGVLGNDTVNGAVMASHTNPAHGSLALNSNGAFTYSPSFWFVGVDSFTYTLKNSTGTSTATVRIDVPSRADLVVTLSAPSSAKSRSTFTYAVKVTNNGPDPARGVTTALYAPSGLKVSSVSPPAKSFLDLLTWSTATLAQGASVTYSVVVQVAAKAGSRLTAVALTGSGSLDPNLANNAAMTTTKV
jgi:hypothetical protein